MKAVHICCTDMIRKLFQSKKKLEDGRAETSNASRSSREEARKNKENEQEHETKISKKHR